LRAIEIETRLGSSTVNQTDTIPPSTREEKYSFDKTRGENHCDIGKKNNATVNNSNRYCHSVRDR